MKKTLKLLMSFVLLVSLLSMSAMAAGVTGKVAFFDAADDSFLRSFYEETAVYARIEFQAAKSGTASVIAAQYTADGKLIKAEVLTTELAMTSGETVKYDTEDISVSGAESLRIFVWEGLSSAVPVLKTPALLEKKMVTSFYENSGEYTLDDSASYNVEDGAEDAIKVEGTAVVNITGGTFYGGQTPYGGSGNTAVYALGNSVVNISGGEFTINGLAEGDTGHIDLIYAKENATINISGGTFSGVGENAADVWLVNIKDADEDTAKIVITGGTFINWNPAEKATDPNGKCYIAEGYSVIETLEGGNTHYTVVKNVDKFTAKESLTFTHVKENGTIEATLGDVFEAVEGAEINSANIEVTAGEGCTYVKNDTDWTKSTLSFTGAGNVTITITDNVNCNVAEATVAVIEPDPVEKFDIKSASIKVEQTVSLGDLFAEKAEVTVFDEDITVTVTDAEGNSLSDKVTYTADTADWTKSTLTVNYAGSIKVTISDNNFCTATVLEAEVAALDKFTAKENLTFTHVKENGTIEKTLGDIFAAIEGAEINSASVEVTVSEGCTYVKNDADWTASTLAFTGTGDVTITITDNVNCKVATATVSITTPAPVEKFTAKAVEMKAEQTVSLGDLFAEKTEVTVFDEDITVTVTDAEGNSLSDKITYTADTADWTKSTLTVNYSGNIKVTISDNNFCTATVLEAEVAALDKFTAKENLTFTHVKENGTIEKTLGDIFAAIEGASINSASVEVTVSEGCAYVKNDADWTASTLAFTGTGNVAITITDNVNCKVATATVTITTPAPVEKFTAKAVEMKAEQTVTLGDLFAEKADVTVFDEDITVTVTDAEGNSLSDKVTYTEDNTDWTKSTLTVNYAGSIKVTISDNNFCTATVLEAEVAALDKFTAKENLTFTHVKENGTIEKTLGDIFAAIEGASINSASVEVTVSEGCTYVKNDADWTASTLAFTGTGNVAITITDNVNCKVATATVSITTPAPVEKFTKKAASMKAEQTVTLGDLFAEKAEVTVFDEDITVTVTDAEGNSLSDKITYTEDNTDWTKSTLTVNYAGSIKVTISDNNFCTATVLEAEVAALDKFTAKENLTFTHVKENGTIEKTLGDIFAALDGASINSASIEVTVSEGCTYVKNDADWTASTLAFTGTGDVTITITDNVNCKVATATVSITTPAPVEKFTAKAVEMKAEQTVALGDLFAEKTEVTVFDEDITVTVTDAEGNSLSDKVTYTADTADWTKSTLTVNYAGSIKVTISDNNFCTATVLEAEVAALDKFTAKENLTFTHVKENGTIEKTLGDIFAAIEGAEINSASVEVTVSEGCTYVKNDADWTASTLSFTGTGDVAITTTDNVNCKVATATVSITTPAPVEKFTAKAVEMKAEQTVSLGDLFAEKTEVTVFDEDITVTVTDAEGNSLSDKVTYTADKADWTKSTLTVNYSGSIKVTISDNNFCTATVLEAEVAALEKFTAKENLTFTHVKENGTIEKTLGDIFAAIEGADINSANVEVTVSEGCAYVKNDADWTKSTLSFTGTGNVAITITESSNTATATVTITEPEVTDKFALKFKNTDTYLYRVGNQNTVALGSLFEAVDDAEIGDVAITVEALSGNSVSGTYTKNATWANGTIKFADTGVVRVTIDDDRYTNALSLNLEVVNAKNVTTASFSGNTVLLNDVSTSTAISANGIVYGNGFTVNMENAPIKNDNGAVFHLYDGTVLKNIKIVGKEFTTVSMSINDTDYGVSAVRGWGTVVIEDSYISGCRSAVAAVGTELTIKNSVIANGIYANVDFRSGILNLHNVTTINEPHTVDGKTIIGLGIVGNMTASPGRQINITGNLTQYNWVSQSDSENIKVTGVSNILKSVYTNDEYAQWRHSYNGTIYASTGIISLCEDFGESGLSGMPSNYTGKSVTASIGGITVNGYAWAPALGRDLTDEEMAYHDATYEWSAENQGTSFVVPAFDFTNNGLEVESGVVQIGYENGSSYTLSAETLDAIIDTAKYGNPLSYRVLMDGVDYTGKDIIFDETASNTYTITYVVTDDAVYDENGALSEATYEVTKQFKVFATVTDKAADVPAFTFHYGTNGSASGGTPHTTQPTSTYASTIKQIGETYYIMPDVSATTADAIGAQTVDGQTVYYPIVDGINVRSGNSTDYDFARYYPIFKATTINDNGTVYSYSETKEMPATVSWESWTNDGGNGNSALNDSFSLYNNQYLCRAQKAAGNAESGGTAVVKYSYTAVDGNTYYYYVGYRFYDESEGGGCVTPETLITLADGSQKEIQDLTGEEMLLVWNHTTGAYDEAPVAYIVNHDTEDKEHEIITLTFDDGKEIEIIGEHVFFDVNEKKYVTLDSNAETFIGSEFAVNSDLGLASAKLINVEKEYRNTRAYEVVTYKHMTCFTENILSASAYMDKLLNVFDIDDTYAYNSEKMAEDIETYGLYTYEDFKDIVPEKTFELYNAAYLKVAVGKGYITWDDILALVEVYNDLGIVPMK